MIVAPPEAFHVPVSSSDVMTGCTAGTVPHAERKSIAATAVNNHISRHLDNSLIAITPSTPLFESR